MRLSIRLVPFPRAFGRLAILLLASGAPGAAAQVEGQGPRFVNPRGLATPTGYTHVVIAPDGRTAYIAGQVAFDSTGRLVGAGDFRAQVEQVFANLRRALASIGASFRDLLKTTTFVTDLTQLAVLREVRARYLDPANPPASTVAQVASLVRPELLIEIEAVAVVPRVGRP